MRVIKPSRVKQFIQQYPDAAASLKVWLTAAKVAAWNSINDVRKAYPSADGAKVGSGKMATVFNIGGNKYRLITIIKYVTKTLYVKLFLTHAEYDKQKWKGQL